MPSVPSAIAPLLQAAVEYGAAASSSVGATGGGSTLGPGSPAGNAVAALRGPLGFGLAGALLVWLLLRGRGRPSMGSLLGNALLAAVGAGAAYAIAVWKHLL